MLSPRQETLFKFPFQEIAKPKHIIITIFVGKWVADVIGPNDIFYCHLSLNYRLFASVVYINHEELCTQSLYNICHLKK